MKTITNTNHSLLTLLSLIFTFVSFFSGFGSVANAAGSDISGYCATIYAKASDPTYTPSVVGLICPIAAGINILLFASATVFAIMIGYGAIKLSMALGDPKGFEAAKMTMFYAFVGFAVVMASWTIMSILNGMLGVRGLTGPDSIFNGYRTNVCKLFRQMGVTDSDAC